MKTFIEHFDIQGGKKLGIHIQKENDMVGIVLRIDGQNPISFDISELFKQDERKC